MDIEREYLKDVESLVPYPEIAIEVLNIAGAEDCNFSKLSRKIEQDQSMAANMLRMANSSYYGHMKKITSIPDIVVRLGLESVRHIAISSASIGVLKTPQEAYYLEPGELWQHAFATANLAEIIGGYAKFQNCTALYTAGLLHDVGKVILNGPLIKEIFSFPDKAQKHQSDIIELEREFLYTDHAKVGMALLQKWNLPDGITIPVGFHHFHDPAKTDRLATEIVSLSNILVQRIDFNSIEEDRYILEVKESVDQSNNLPNPPYFKENIESIFREFYKKIYDRMMLFV